EPGIAHNGIGELSHSLVPYCNCFDDRRLPPVGAFGYREHRFEFSLGPQNAFSVRLVYDEDVADFHYAGLNGLNIVTHAGYQHDNGHVSSFYYVDFVLSHPNRFNDYLIISGRVEYGDSVGGGARQSAEVPAGCHTANEDSRISSHALHSDAVSEYGPSSEGAGRIYRDYPDRLAGRTVVGGKRID